MCCEKEKAEMVNQAADLLYKTLRSENDCLKDQIAIKDEEIEELTESLLTLERQRAGFLRVMELLSNL